MTEQPLPTFEHAIASLDAETPADWDAYLHCVSLVARIFGKTQAEVHAAVERYQAEHQ